MSDLYAVLGVSPKSEAVIIQAAYRALMRKYHPDMSLSPDAAAKSAEINEAYSVIGNPEARQLYDQRREAEDSQDSRNSSGKKAANGGEVEAPPENVDGSEDKQSEESRLGAKERSRTGGARLAFAVLILFFIGFMAFVFVGAQKKASQTELASGASPAQGNESSSTIRGPDFMNTEFANTNGTEVVAPPTPPDLSHQPQTPVDYSNVESASNHFASTLTRRGVTGARIFSEKCHRDVKNAPTWSTVDNCAAFDYAAAYVDEGVTAGSPGAKNGYFQFERDNQADNYISLGASSYAISTRLTQIRSAAETAVVGAISSATARLNAAPPSERVAPAANSSARTPADPGPIPPQQNQTG